MEIASSLFCGTAPCTAKPSTLYAVRVPLCKNLKPRCHANLFHNSSSNICWQKQRIPIFIEKKNKNTFQCICRAGGKIISQTDNGFALDVETPGGKAAEGLDNLQTLVSTSSEYIKSLPHEVKKRVEALQELQAQHGELETKFFEEKAALEAKYQKCYEPIYKKRSDIVKGVVDVEDAKKDKNEESKQEPSDLEEGVPEFWLTAMMNNDTLAMQITDRDEDALKFLNDIQCSRFVSDEVEKGFKLEFFFNENPYFKNTALTKIYYMVDENEPILDRVTGTEIDWLPGKNLTRKVMKKKPKKGAKDAKAEIKTVQCKSFFIFFYPPKFPEDDVDEDAAEEFQNLMEQDYEIGSTIRDDLFPHAVSWFTGEAIDGNDDEYNFDDDNESDRG